MVAGGRQQKTLDLGFLLLGNRQQSVAVTFRELVLSDGLEPMLPNIDPETLPLGYLGRLKYSKNDEKAEMVGEWWIIALKEEQYV
ncbi:unnamed protein product [Schistosoma margrebowiei]|uniref:Uncharacterized protein n=1 Tax=Schistosoma margrebowiei TaxID=48269 RepID=A0A183LHQ1_9TREM|nr:unnamed protein product [Schistosoma margrebowiei]